MIRLFRYLKPFKLLIAASLVLVMIRALADLYLPTLSADIVNIGIVNVDIPYIWRVGALMLAVAAVSTSAFVLASFLSSKASAGFGKNLREEVYTKVSSFSLQEFDRFGSSSLINRTTNDITQLQRFLMFSLRMMVIAPMLSIGSITLAFSRDAALAVIFVVVVPIMFTLIFIVMRKGLPLFGSMQEKLDALNRIVREGLTGMRVIRAFNRDEYEKQRFKEANEEYRTTAVRVFRIMASMMPLMQLIMNLAIISIVWFAAIRIDLGYTNVGDLMALIQYAMHVMFSFVAISRIFVMIPRAAASAARVNEVIETVPEIKDAEQLKQLEGTKGRVEFRDVTFSYPGAERPVLNNISFEVGPGEVTAIIGSTGAGKSTLLNLLMRFYDVDSGSILLDGVNIREISQEELRSRIGFVPQNAVLFSGTIMDNIRYSKEDAREEEVYKAAEIAQASEFISQMKDGFSSVIAQGGKNISGGQKQRLSIARALLKNPEIYLFDDSFSALDFKTDAKLRSALYKEIKEASVFIVSQRVNTVKDADRIMVLDEGRIAGMGTHSELLEECEVYREIFASQLSEEEIA